MQIQHWEFSFRVMVIARRRVHNEVALVAKKARVELLVFAELSEAHK